MPERNSAVQKTVISYKLSPIDALAHILRANWVLVVIPLIFLAMHVLLYFFGTHNTMEKFSSFLLFSVVSLIVISVFIKKYYAFKKQYFLLDKAVAYFAEFSKSGIAVYQDFRANFTEYIWCDFTGCTESKRAFYLYFRRGRVLIIKKQLFLTGSVSDIRELLSAQNFCSKLLKK